MCWIYSRSNLDSMKKSWVSDHGQAIVEYAVVLPVLLLLLVMGLQISIFSINKIALANAAYDAARAKATIAVPGNTGELAAIRDLARRRAAALGNLGFLNMNVSVSLATSAEVATAKVGLEQDMLPLIKQATMAAGGKGRISLRETAVVPMEPYQK